MCDTLKPCPTLQDQLRRGVNLVILGSGQTSSRTCVDFCLVAVIIWPKFMPVVLDATLLFHEVVLALILLADARGGGVTCTTQ